MLSIVLVGWCFSRMVDDFLVGWMAPAAGRKVFDEGWSC